MPSVAVVPAQFTLTGGTVGTIPARVTPSRLRLVFAGGNVNAGPGTGISSSVTQPTLNRLHGKEQLTGPGGTPTHRLMAIWQEAMDKIEDAFAGLTTQVTDLETLLLQIQAAQDLAQAANDNANAVTRRVALTNSYTDPVTILSASNDGSITIAAHDRVYGDGTRVSVDAGSVSGFASGAYVTVYYMDAGREGGAVLYKGTTGAISQEGDTHIVGQVTIPAAGEAPSSGSGTTAPGYRPPDGSGTYDPDYVEP